MQLDDLLDGKELDSLRARFGPFGRVGVTIRADAGFYNWLHGDLIENRKKRGEVVIALPDGDGHVWLHTKRSYSDCPYEVYRLLSGGIRWGEGVLAALERELLEETGIRAAPARFIGVADYRFVWPGGESLPFVSYVFLVEGSTDAPECHDKQEGISGFRTKPTGELADVALELRSLKEDFWKCWGVFRAVPHEMAAAFFG